MMEGHGHRAVNRLCHTQARIQGGSKGARAPRVGEKEKNEKRRKKKKKRRRKEGEKNETKKEGH